jgi:hypothetical protein
VVKTATEEVNNMSADKVNKIEQDVKEIHTRIKKSNLVLRKRIKDIQEDMREWNFLSELTDDKSKGNGHLR